MDEMACQGRWPYYSDNEINAAIKVLRSGKVNYWTGHQCRKFEKEFAKFCSSKHAIALSNGTVALELALRALGINPGDEVIVPCRTFIASAGAVVNAGATPVFADVDQDSQNLTIDTIRSVLTPRTKAIIAVHLAGWPCEMDSIMKFASENGLKVIEDCAQAHGAIYKGKPVGSLGDAAAFSFCQDKIISTGGEGGMLVTNDNETWQTAWSYKDHGKSYNEMYQTEHPPGFRWVHHSIGSNWRMTEMQAAIGRMQLRKLPQWHVRRNSNAEILARRFLDIPGLRVTQKPGYIEHAYYKYDVFLKPEELKDGWSKERILAAINAKGGSCLSGICPEIYLEKAFDSTESRPSKRLPVARKLGETGLTFLVHPTLGDKDMERVCDVVESVMKEAVNTQLYHDFVMKNPFTPMEADVLLTHT
jgi:dTDP-4-amino-4,6-dideoxygalactose transaminase